MAKKQKVSKRLSEQLTKHGAVLKRTSKHRVYQLPNGQVFVIATTPSDRRGEQNALSDLRRRAQLAERHKHGSHKTGKDSNVRSGR